MMTSVHGYFNMITDTDMERYRAETFLTKEPETIAWIDDMKPGEVLYDVGANVGVYTLYAASRGIQVVAIEPVLENYVRLVQNIETNRFNTTVIPIYGAAGGFPSDEISLSNIGINNNTIGASGAQVGMYGSISRRIFMMPLEKIARECGNIIDHVKIDVDGQEESVISSVYYRPIKSFLIEINPPWTAKCARIALWDQYTTDNKYNTMTPHSRERRQREGIAAENVIFTRR